MGSLNDLSGRLVYLDANIFIYALEGYPQLDAAVRALLTRIDTGEIAAITSELTLAELLVRPMREGDEVRQSRCHEMISSRAGFSVFPVTREVLIEAARLRAGSSLKLPDAIHAGTARLTGCSVYLTNDGRLRGVSCPEVVLVSELTAL